MPASTALVVPATAGPDGRRSRPHRRSRRTKPWVVGACHDGSTTSPPMSVGEVLRVTSPTILEGHLVWLGSRSWREPQHSPQRILLEDQARILIDALDARGEYSTITRALQRLWIAEDVPDDDDAVTTYASDLDRVTAGQPGYSPYVALAQSATRVSTEVRTFRHPRGSGSPSHDACALRRGRLRLPGQTSCPRSRSTRRPRRCAGRLRGWRCGSPARAGPAGSRRRRRSGRRGSRRRAEWRPDLVIEGQGLDDPVDGHPRRRRASTGRRCSRRLVRNRRRGRAARSSAPA